MPAFRSSLLASFALALPVSLVAGTAYADPKSEASAKLYTDATTAATNHDYASCVAKAEQAWGLFQHAQIRGIEGFCETELGKYKIGATHLSFYLKNSASDVEPQMTSAFAKAREHVAEVTIQCDAMADVAVDGEAVGKCGAVVFLEPGSHSLEANRDGHQVAAQRADFVAGTHIDMTLITNPKGGGVYYAPRPLWPALLGYAIGVVGIGIGAGTAIAANGQDAGVDCKGTYDTCSGNQTTQNTLSNASLWTFVAGGAVALASTGYLIWAVSGKKTSAASTGFQIAPIAAPGTGGAILRGTF